MFMPSAPLYCHERYRMFYRERERGKLLIGNQRLWHTLGSCSCEASFSFKISTGRAHSLKVENEKQCPLCVCFVSNIYFQRAVFLLGIIFFLCLSLAATITKQHTPWAGLKKRSGRPVKATQRAALVHFADRPAKLFLFRERLCCRRSSRQSRTDTKSIW